MHLEEHPYVRNLLFCVQASENYTYICSELSFNNCELQ
jgi:hypothetical protein